jgi:transposase
VEGTGSYGAGLARLLRTAGVGVVEVDRPNRQACRRHGKSDPLGAVEAFRAAQAGRAFGAAKTRDGNVEAIRALVVATRSHQGEQPPLRSPARSTGTSPAPEIRSGEPGPITARRPPAVLRTICRPAAPTSSPERMA